MRVIRLVTFDITGTILKVKTTVGEQYSKVLHKFYNQTCDSYDLQISFADSYKNHLKKSPMFGIHNGITSKEWWGSVFIEAVLNSSSRSLCEGSVVPYQVKDGVEIWKTCKSPQAEQLQSAVDDIYWNFQWLPCHSVVETLQTVANLKRTQDLTVGVISNNDERIFHTLKSSGIPMPFDFVISSHNYGFEKPDPRIFHAAIEKVKELHRKDIHPSEMLHVGDSLEKDYFGAISAGCNALLLDPTGQLNKENQEHIISSLNQVLKYFKQI
uniref:Haloacid dehalogenase-like hydrolase domain-containing protein 3 n=1 Tax=Ciona savignyi TaxID=51511 RepID=H2Y4H9_CIOSA